MTKSIFIPGDEWLYIRIYAGFDTVEKILLKNLCPLGDSLIENEKAELWFFVRYSDPDHHLRFRIKLSDIKLTELILADLQRSLNVYIESGLVWKVEISSYIPEIERYGAETISHVEQLFYHDSHALIRFLDDPLLMNDGDSRWLYAIASVHQLLCDFEIPDTDRKDLLLGLNRSFGSEFNKDKHLAKQISGKYRSHRIRIESLLSDEDSVDKIINSIVNNRSNASKSSIMAILRHYENNNSGPPLYDLLSSIIHMTMNRIFQNNNRLHEMVIYDFLFRYYKSMVYLDTGS